MQLGVTKGAVTMTEPEMTTTVADWGGVTQGAGISHGGSATDGSNLRYQIREQSDTLNRAFVPISGHRNGAADVKAIATRRGREQNQGQNGSRGDDDELAEMVEAPAEQIDETAKAPASGRSDAVQNTSNGVADRDGELADKLAAVRAQIADLLDLIEASQPGFAKAVMPKIETDADAAGPAAKPHTGDKQALLASLQELAGLLEELLDLLKNTDTDNAGGNAGTAMDAVAPGYAPVSSRPEVQDAEEMFMSIYDQLSTDTRLEVAEILAAMAFERQNADGAFSEFLSGSSRQIEDLDGNDVAGDGVTVDALRANPGILSRAGIQGVRVNGMDLFIDPDGTLSEKSKIEVNKLIGYLSDLLGRIEVVANVYVDDSENIGIHLTAGKEDSAIFYPMEGTIYSAHVHTNGSWVPSRLDRENEIPGAEDAIVAGDGVAGNETGDYFQYA
jgi:hypothetical protein